MRTDAQLRGEQTATIDFENDEVGVQLGDTRFVSRTLSNQSFGSVWLAAWQADVDVHEAELISRDTVEPLDS